MFDLCGLKEAVARRGPVARVVIAGLAGSSPREIGTAMLVWSDGQSGTIGGGALEWQAINRAREMLARGGHRLDREPLGPALGQCCGGAVTLLTEVFGAAEVAALSGTVVMRPVGPEAGEMPLALQRIQARARDQGFMPRSGLVQGWMVEPVLRAERMLWVWGAGHVGRAVVSVLAPLPQIATTWVDVDLARFPEAVPQGVTVLPTTEPALLVPHAPREAEHLILTYSHALDLTLCHSLLLRGFSRCGLIGSATKWARFRGRLAALGHSPAQIARIECPIGDPSLGKHPQEIAIGVATALLHRNATVLTEGQRA